MSTSFPVGSSIEQPDVALSEFIAWNLRRDARITTVPGSATGLASGSAVRNETAAVHLKSADEQ